MIKFYGVFISNNSGVDQNSNGKEPNNPTHLHLSLGSILKLMPRKYPILIVELLVNLVYLTC